jgi:superfamily II DNA or RNA helicase
MLALRDYQQDLIDRLYALFDRGRRVVMVQSPTGSGKSCIFSQLVIDARKEFLKRVLVVVHTEELVLQNAAHLERYLPGQVGIIKAGQPKSYWSPVQSASAQTLVNRFDVVGDFDIVIIDECFPAGTLVDGKPIESLKVGDIVSSFNESTKKIEMKPIVRLFKKSARKLVNVSARNKTITCTPEHPFYTQRGWIPAYQLTNEDYLYVDRMPELSKNILTSDYSGTHNYKRQESLLLNGLPKSLFKNYSQADFLPRLYELSGIVLRKKPSRKNIQNSSLRQGLFRSAEKKNIFRNNGKNKSSSLLRKNEEQQSDGKYRVQRENDCNFEEDWTQAFCLWGERYRIDKATASTIRCSEQKISRLDDGTSIGDREWIQTISLQDRYRAFSQDDSNRNRWFFPLCNFSTNFRQEEGRILDWIGVESVEISEQGSLAGSGSCDVYNIEVLDNHNYFVDGVLVHNCHHSSSPTFRKIIAQYPNAQIIGLTATPIRTDGKGFEDLYEELICGISTAELIEQGHLSRYVLEADKRPMTKSTRLIGGDYNLQDLADLNDSIELAGDLVKSYQEYANGGSCITFAINVEHSESIAAAYNAAGVSALHLDAKAPKDIRASALSKLASGEIKVLVNVGLFGEGVDVPTLDCVQIARPTKSVGLHLQMLGRVLRKAPGKEYGLILDHTDNYAMLGLPDDNWQWKLEGKPKKERVVNEAKERKEAAQVERKVIKELKLLGLVRIASRADGAQYWDDLLERTKYQQVSAGKKAMWLAYRMESKYPPLRIWLAIAEYVKKSQEWGQAKFDEQNRLAAIDGLRAASRATDGLRAIEAVRSRWDPDVLQAASRLIATEQRDKIKQLVEMDNDRKKEIAA